MRLLITADLHYNHPKSKPLAEDVITRMNAAGGDVLVVVGDAAVADGDALEHCLTRFQFSGPKLFIAGNHDLWTHGPDSHALFEHVLPARIRSLGWHWLETDPFLAGNIAIVGTMGWYDYTFAAPGLGIPRRFYEQKISPGAAARFSEYASLFQPPDDITPEAMHVFARWNDGKFVKLRRSDGAFTEESVVRLQTHLTAVSGRPEVRDIIACVHHVPFRELLPPAFGGQWGFVRAYLGSERLGQTLLAHEKVSRVFCGHSHLPAEARLGPAGRVKAVNIGSGYRWKTFVTEEA